MDFVANLTGFSAMQKFWKSVKIWQSYREFKGGNLLRHSVEAFSGNVWQTTSWLSLVWKFYVCVWDAVVIIHLEYQQKSFSGRALKRGACQLTITKAMVTCELKLFPNYFRHCWCPTEIFLYQRMETCLKLFHSYFRSLLQLMNIFQHVQWPWNNFSGWNNFV